MTKSQLIEAVAVKCNLKKKQASEIVDCVFDTVGEALLQEEKVQISGFGTFETRKRAARIGRDPQTGAPLSIPPFQSAAFSQSQNLKNKLNGI